MVFLVCRKDDNILTPIGIATTEEKAKRASSGTYVIIPLRLDVNYGENIASESMAGAFQWEPLTDGLEAMIAALSEDMDTFRQQAINQLNALSDRITVLENA